MPEEAPWQHASLSQQPEDLSLPGFWGRFDQPLPSLPPELHPHDSRCAELLVKTLAPLAPALSRARERYGAKRIAIVLGSSTGGIDATESALREERLTGSMPDSYVFEEAHVYHALIRVIRGLHAIEGPGYVVSTACSSAGKALAASHRLLVAGAADAVLVGGVDAMCEMTLRGFGGLGILSPERCRPFDAGRRGINIGEGSAVLLLERETRSPYVLLGVGESSDAHHLTAPHPDGLGARLAIARALECAGITAGEVDYVNAHGTGTAQNDVAEARAIVAELGPVPFSSTKDRTGHQLGTAGATEAVFCLEALARGEVPPNQPIVQRDEQLAAQPYDGSGPVPPAPGTVLSNSFAFGGSNVCVALGKRPEAAKARSGVLPGKLFVLGVAAWAPGRPNLESVLRAHTPFAVEPPPARVLPARTRGRASDLTRMIAELYAQLRGTDEAPRFDERAVALITGSAYGEMTTTIRLLEQLQTDPTLSPARFQASVHNTATGLLSIATENREYSTALAAGDATVAMALLDAHCWLSTQGGHALVLVADEAGPERLLRGEPFPALAVGFHLYWGSEAPSGALVSLSMNEASEHPIAPSALAAEFPGAPAGWGLSLLQNAHERRAGRVDVGYRWQLDVTPV